MKTLAELLKEEEERLLEQTRREIAAEDAAWAALPQAEKDRIEAERQARYFTNDIPDVEDDEDEDDTENGELL